MRKKKIILFLCTQIQQKMYFIILNVHFSIFVTHPIEQVFDNLVPILVPRRQHLTISGG